MMAPEGTRLDTTEVGPFKKGPFRLAMAAGIPIVPIVIRNAEIVASRNSTTINPGTVDVAVFPPIPVDGWTIQTLPEHIARIRQLYLDTLADWPVDELPEVDLDAPVKKAAPKTPAKKAPAKKAAAKAPAKKAPAKKAAAKAPAKKTAAKKAPAKAAAKKTPAKKTAAKKTVAKKAPAKKTAKATPPEGQP
jgi:putative phosphoserine phosphatase/1-acylglycerol-3-phosphate O-acyltransferase